MVFVDEVVAVEHVDAVPGSVLGEDADLFVGAEEDNVFQSDFLFGRILVVSRRREEKVRLKLDGKCLTSYSSTGRLPSVRDIIWKSTR